MPRLTREDVNIESLEPRIVLAAFATPGEPLAVSLSDRDQFVVAAVDTDGAFRTFEGGFGLFNTTSESTDENLTDEVIDDLLNLQTPDVVQDFTDDITGDLFDDVFGSVFGQPPAVLAEPADGEWFTRAQDEDTSLPSGTVAAWRSPFNGDSFAAAPTPEGVAIYTRDSDGSDWDTEVITMSDDGIVVSGVVAAATGDRMYVAGLNADGDLILYENDDSGWTQRNLTDEVFAGVGPGFEGRMIAYSTSWNAVNIAGLNADGDIVTVWTAPGLDTWFTNNLSAPAGAPAFVGGLSVYTTPWSGVNLTGVTADGALHAVWWVPDFGGDWAVTDFQAEFGGPDLVPDSVTAYRTPWNGLNVAGLDASGALHTYWWVPEFAADPANDFWRVEDLSDDFNSAETRPAGPLSAIVSDDGVIAIFGIEDDGEVVEIYWTSDDGWRSANISADAIEL